MKNRIFSFMKPRLALLLAVAMLVSMLPVSVFAEEAEPTWDSLVTGDFQEKASSLESYTKYVLSDGEVVAQTVTIDSTAAVGSETNPIAISSVEDLIRFGKQSVVSVYHPANPTKGKYYILTEKNYDLSAHPMMPLAATAVNIYASMTYIMGFCGTLIGNGATIANARVIGGMRNYQGGGNQAHNLNVQPGLFSDLNGGCIWDLTLDNIQVSGGSGHMGVLYGQSHDLSDASMVNVTVTNSSLTPNDQITALSILGEKAVGSTADVTMAGDATLSGDLNLYSGEKLTVAQNTELEMIEPAVLTVKAGAELVNNGLIVGEVVVEDGGICSGDGAMRIHSGGTANCVDRAVCEHCGRSYGQTLNTHVIRNGVCVNCSGTPEITIEMDAAYSWLSWKSRYIEIYADGALYAKVSAGDSSSGTWTGSMDPHRTYTFRWCGSNYDDGNTYTFDIVMMGKKVLSAEGKDGNSGTVLTVEPSCMHSEFVDSVCTLCGVACIHIFDENSTCIECGYICAEHTWNEGACSVCGYRCVHAWSNNTCMICGYLRKIVIDMTDRYSDGWTGCGIMIYQNDVCIDTATLTRGSNGQWSGSFDPHGSYTFKWVAGSYPEETTFVIWVDGAELLSGTGGNYAEGEVLATAGPVCDEPNYTDGICTNCGGNCGHIFDKNGSCNVCGYTCTDHTWNDCVCEKCGTSHHTWSGGYCVDCGAGEEQPEGSGTQEDPYRIANAGQLYWFAQQVNGGSTDIHGKLVENILINENVLTEDGTPNRGQFRAWTPMGNYGNRYTGTFDGNGKTISGLYFKDSAADYVGLFGYVGDGGIVKNVGVLASYFSGRAYVGGVVAANSGTVTDSNNSGIVTGEGDYVGGVVGHNDCGTVTNSYNSGSVSGNDYVGGVVGYNDCGTVTYSNNSGIVTGKGENVGSLTGAGDRVGGVVGCNYEGTVTDCDNSGSVTSTGDYVGGVVGLHRYGTVTGSHNSGSVTSAGEDVGGVVGYNNEGTVTDCDNSGIVSGKRRVGGVTGENWYGPVTNSYNSGSVTSAGNYVGGVVGANYGTVTGSYNTGSVSGSKYVGGVVGYNYDSTVTDSYNTGSVSGSTNVGGVVGYNPEGKVTGCYYLEGTATGGIDGADVAGQAEARTAKQFASGEMTWLLNGGTSDGVWKQNIGTDSLPNFVGGFVYYGYASCADQEKVYTNNSAASDTPIAHSWENGICVVCDAFSQPEGSGTAEDPYQIGNAGQLYWFAQQVNGGNTAIHGKLVKNIRINENVLAQDGTLNEGQFRVWTPMGNYGNRYTGTFDGNGKTISGLYFNDSAAEYVGLFGYVAYSGTVKNVGILDSYFSGDYYVGGVVGLSDDGTVTDSYNTGSVSGSSSVGGVVGYNAHGTVTDCYNSGSVSGIGNKVGGVVGYNTFSTVTDCYNTGRVTGSSYVGGVVGENFGTVTSCYSTRSVSGDYNVGGVVGKNDRTVTGCYYLEGTAAGGINGKDAAGQAKAKTAEQFASGEVAYLLGEAFGQTIGEDSDPVLGGAKVYYGYLSCAEDADKVYTNDSSAVDTKPEHTGTLGAPVPTEDGTQHARTYDCCDTTVIEDHSADEEIGQTCMGYLCTVCESWFDEVTYYNHVGDMIAVFEWPDSSSEYMEVYVGLKCGACGENTDYFYAYGDAITVETVPGTDCENPGTATCILTYEYNGVTYSDTKTYTIPSDNHKAMGDSGFCSACGGFEAAVWNEDEGVYEISNAGQLYWYAQELNTNNSEIYVKLMNDIIIPENAPNWKPINASYAYFDGNFKTISGLKCIGSQSDAYVGLFGCEGWWYEIKNLHIQDSCFEGNGYVGAVVACMTNGGSITNCAVTNTTVKGDGDNAGTLAGYLMMGSVINCFVDTDTLVGDYANSYASIENSFYLSDTETEEGGKTAAQFASGEVAYLLQSGILGEDIYDEETGEWIGTAEPELIWGQTIGTEAFPVFGGQKVYQFTDCTNKIAYSNTDAPQKHTGTIKYSYNNDGTHSSAYTCCSEAVTTGETCTSNAKYTCQNGQCTLCGADMPPATGHAGGQAMCSDYYCWHCGELCPGTGEHDYAADCATWCEDCMKNTRPNPPAEHESDAEYVCQDGYCVHCNSELPGTGHDWVDADCDTPKTCSICGDTEGEALGHSWNDATCTDPKTCSVCGETEGEAMGHKLVDRICTVCNKMPLRIEMTNFDATGWNGNAIRVCEDGQLIATVTLAEDKTGDNWYYLGDPDKTYEFYWVKGDYCGGCGFAITIGDETVMIAFADENMEYADGIRIYPACEEHDYRFVEVHEPTCNLVGYTLYVCAVCGESMEDDYVPSLGHTIAEDAVGVVTPPTCENDGYTTYECDYCGESFDTLYLPALPHTLGEDGLCSVCGQPYTVPVWVAGIQIDANNLTDVLGDGTVSYDPSANVLTLNGFAYEGTDAGIYTTMSVNIVLLGENTIHTGYYGILSEVADGELTIRGTGTLTINSDTVGIEMYHYGQASLVFGGSVTVSAYAENAEGIACYSETGEASVVLQDNAKVILGTQEAPLGEECVYVDGFDCGSFTIEDNASIICVNTDEEGIYITGDQQFIVISDNASVNICADEEALDANTIRISGGTVTVIGGEGYEGIYADELIITGGTVTVSTVEVEDRAGDGVEADCITITGGTLKILSGGLMASADGEETNVPGTITLGEGVVIASPAGAVLGQFDLTAIGEGMVLAVLDAEGNFADSLIIQFCVHEWADADCDTPKTCEICGVTEGEAMGHSFENGSCAVCGEPDPDYVDNKPVITLKYPTLSFKDEVLINVYFDVSNMDNVEEMGLILYDTQVETWNIHNAMKVISGYRYSQSKGLYAVTTDGIPAKNLTDTVWFAIYAKLADGSYTYTKLADYSPKMYADSLLGTGDAKLDGLLVSMLNYGAAAQLYFGYKTDDLVNKDLTAEQKALVSGYSSDMVTTSVSVPAEKQGGFLKNVTETEYYPSVSFKGALAINYYCKPETAPADGITLYYWDEAAYASNEVLTAQNAVGTVEMTLTADGEYTASVKGIPARKVNAEVYVAVSYSDGTTTYNSGILPYSIGEYCSAFANTDHEFAPMAEATAVYGYYAKQYFG